MSLRWNWASCIPWTKMTLTPLGYSETSSAAAVQTDNSCIKWHVLSWGTWGLVTSLFFPSFGSEATAFEREIFCFPASPQTADKNFAIIQTISFQWKITEPTGDVMKKTFVIRQRMLLFIKNINIMRQRKQEM